MRTLPHTKSCFVCGEANPHGLNLRSETDGRIVQAHFVPRQEHVGFRDTVHGGLIATLLDEVMVWACAVRTKKFAYCAELNVRFLIPLKPGERALAVAELVVDRRGRLFEANAKLRSDSGKILATAAGKYLPIREATVTEMAADFVGDPQWVFLGAGKESQGPIT
jgi:uncharacterized protein (TIGR00369 family)